MPEGDTIHRAAVHLHSALADREVRAYSAYRPELATPRRTGRTVRRVRAHGKNLFIHFDDRRVLYSHMRMTGAWHIYRPGDPWRKPERFARIVIENDAYQAVCFSAPVLELLTEPELARHPFVSALGPDLLAQRVDFDEAVRRLRAQGDRPLGDAVLDQRCVAGMGNVYKSEMLFLEGLDPFGPVSALDDARLERLLRKTQRMMVHNLRTQKRTLRGEPGSRVWVYERGGKPCFRCGTKVAMERQGDAGRSTYYCAECQGVGG